MCRYSITEKFTETGIQWMGPAVGMKQTFSELEEKIIEII